MAKITRKKIKEIVKVAHEKNEYVDLSGTDLTEIDLSDVVDVAVDLIGANLSNANLSGMKLRGAYLWGAKLNKAKLLDTNLSMASLVTADLSEAELDGAYLYGASLDFANFTSAIIGWTKFDNVDLSRVEGLDTVYHSGPSTIGIDTIYRSQGKIPEIFLRGAGVPDTFITYIHSLTGEAIQYYSCFISYSSKDEAFAKRLHNDLQQEGVRCWFAPEDIKGGDKLYPQIDQAIRLHDKLLLVLSEHSLESEWVKTEIRRARKAELKEKQRKLFPIRLVDMDTLKAWECFDADTGKDLAVEIREYFIPDFSHWHYYNAYQPAFTRLLRDLNTEATKQAT